MRGLIQSAVCKRTEELNREFASSQPFHHLTIDQFLDAEFCRQLVAEFPSFDAAHAVNEHGDVGRKAVTADLARAGPAYARFDQMLRSHEFLKLIGKITGIPKLLYDPEYVGGGTHENLNGQDLDAHVDFNYHPTRRWHRRLNLIVFLNPEWEQSWGGCLEFLRDPWTGEGSRAVALAVPLLNRAVIFETNEHSWHGFRPIQLPPGKEHLSRRSIAVYLYTEERPSAETAAAHGTVYVQRQLPEHFTPGYTLGEEDVEEIQVLLKRRDQQIQFLYKRELKFSALIDGLTRSASFRLGRALTWPARKFRRSQ